MRTQDASSKSATAQVGGTRHKVYMRHKVADLVKDFSVQCLRLTQHDRENDWKRSVGEWNEHHEKLVI